MNALLASCRSRTNLTSAVNTALVVGPALALINQTKLLWGLVQGQAMPASGLLRIALTFAVPFLVSLYSSGNCRRRKVGADRGTRSGFEHP